MWPVEICLLDFTKNLGFQLFQNLSLLFSNLQVNLMICEDLTTMHETLLVAGQVIIVAN